MTKTNEHLSRLYQGRSEEVLARSVKRGDLIIISKRFGLEAVASLVTDVRTVKARIRGRYTHAVEITSESGISGFPVITSRAKASGKVLVAR